MSKNIRLKWEPKNVSSLEEIELNLVKTFEGKKTGVTMLMNGTLLFIDDHGDPVENAKKALNEAKFIINFRIINIENNAVLVVLHDAVAVYVSSEEFRSLKNEIKNRVEELKFPSEDIAVPASWSEDDFLVGLYGRAKLHRDANNFSYYKRLEFSGNQA